MYAIRDLNVHLRKINEHRAERGLSTIRPSKWADVISGTKQVWFTACLPKARTGTVEGMADQAKVLELLACVNKSLTNHNLATIPASDIVELADANYAK